MISKVLTSFLLILVATIVGSAPPTVRYTQPIVATVSQSQYPHQAQYGQPTHPQIPQHSQYGQPQHLQSPQYGQPQQVPLGPQQYAIPPQYAQPSPAIPVEKFAQTPLPVRAPQLAPPQVVRNIANPSLLGVAYSPVQPGTATLHFKGFGTSYTLF